MLLTSISFDLDLVTIVIFGVLVDLFPLTFGFLFELIFGLELFEVAVELVLFDVVVELVPCSFSC
jgi:hypothetical protein